MGLHLPTLSTQPFVGAVDDLVTMTDDISLQRIDEAAAVGRPANVGITHAEREFNALAEEQLVSWPAEAEAAARPARLSASRVAPAAEAADFVTAEHQKELTRARDARQHALETLLPFVRRPPHDNARYWAGWVVLGLGDTVGVWGAAISLGEIPELAFGQALATGFAAVTAGLVGGEVRALAQAKSRRRDPDELTENERRYRRLFEGVEPEVPVLKIASGVAASVIALVAGSVFALRALTEGAMAGLVFGGLATATMLASFISSFIHADEVADLLDHYEQEHRRAIKGYRKASKAKPLQVSGASTAEADSIEREYGRRALAAANKVEACKQRMLRRNPQVVGHGDVTQPVTARAGLHAEKGAAA